jgi:EamA domain-containing membrane protein RarD
MRIKPLVRDLLSNWLWIAVVLALIGVVVWGWAFDFSPR